MVSDLRVALRLVMRRRGGALTSTLRARVAPETSLESTACSSRAAASGPDYATPVSPDNTGGGGAILLRGRVAARITPGRAVVASG
ncbi:MAG: hypothetical protein GY938_22890 [Ketobacter sp.]|nr:hypothetical protein [Ketobacter sp.]